MTFQVMRSFLILLLNNGLLVSLWAHIDKTQHVKLYAAGEEIYTNNTLMVVSNSADSSTTKLPQKFNKVWPALRPGQTSDQRKSRDVDMSKSWKTLTTNLDLSQSVLKVSKTIKRKTLPLDGAHKFERSRSDQDALGLMQVNKARTIDGRLTGYMHEMHRLQQQEAAPTLSKDGQTPVTRSPALQTQILVPISSEISSFNTNLNSTPIVVQDALSGRRQSQKLNRSSGYYPAIEDGSTEPPLVHEAAERDGTETWDHQILVNIWYLIMGYTTNPPSVWGQEDENNNKQCPQSEETYIYQSQNSSIQWSSTVCPEVVYCTFKIEIAKHQESRFTLVLEFEYVSFAYTEHSNFMDRLSVSCKDVFVTVTGTLQVAPVWCSTSSADIALVASGFKKSSFKILYYSNVFHFCRLKTYYNKNRSFISHICLLNMGYNDSITCKSNTNLSKNSKMIFVGDNTLANFFKCNGVTEVNCGGKSYDEKKCVQEICEQYGIPFMNECFFIKFYNLSNHITCSGHLTNSAFLYPSVRNFIRKKVSTSRMYYHTVWNENDFRTLSEIDNSHKILTGVQKIISDNKHIDYLYKYMWWWKDYKVVVHDMLPHRYGSDFGSGNDKRYYNIPAHLQIYPSGYMAMHPSRNDFTLTVCHMYNKKKQHLFRSNKLKHHSNLKKIPEKFPTQLCPSGHYRHKFHACESASVLRAGARNNSLPMFNCANGLSVHYTLTCDGLDDCIDNSDEVNCVLVGEWLVKGVNRVFTNSFYLCSESKEIIIGHNRCDGRPDCFDNSDEKLCNLHECHSNNVIQLSGKTKVCLPNLTMCPKQDLMRDKYTGVKKKINRDIMISSRYIMQDNSYTLLEDLKPWVVHLDGCGGSYLTPLNETEKCPETHVRCPDAYCIPSYMLNNGVYDCPHLETDDEYVGPDFACPGQYRCYKSHICVHNTYLCDGVYHCPLKDDERYCKINCPSYCFCEGYAMKCTDMINPLENFNVRYLDISGVNLSGHYKVDHLHYLPFLRFLNTSSCSLSTLDLSSLLILQILDVSGNRFKNFHVLRFPNNSDVALKKLYLSGNPLTFSIQSGLNEILCKIGINLQVLNIDNTGLRSLLSDKTYCNSSLQKLRITQNQIQITSGSFMGLNNIQVLETSDERLCCLFEITYSKSKVDCIALENELSSCDDLLKSNFLRVCLWLQAIAALLGNGGVLINRIFFERQRVSSGYHYLVTTLCMSDFTMGLYLTIIGSADLYYMGEYLFHTDTWMHSIPCTVAGVLAMVSSEVSAFIICLITVDRLLVVRFPLHRHLHLTWKSALALSGAAWAVGVTLAVVPLLPVHKDWEFYSQNGICLPLPITRQQFPGHGYTFSIFLVLNFVLFLFVGVGQVAIYLFISFTPVAGRSSTRQQEFTIARRLFLIAFTDFCSWFPVGVMGLLAKTGTPISGEVNVWTAVFVLPLNSAINPFLYTLNALRQKRNKKKEREQLQNLVKRFEVEMSTFSEEKLEAFQQVIIRQRMNFRHCSRSVETETTENSATNSSSRIDRR